MKLLMVARQVNCDCCDDKPKQAIHVLRFNNLYDSVYMCHSCYENFRLVATEYFTKESK